MRDSFFLSPEPHDETKFRCRAIADLAGGDNCTGGEGEKAKAGGEY